MIEAGAQVSATAPRNRGRSRIVCLSSGFALLAFATALTVVLERKILVLGPLSTLGLAAVVYLAATWCFAAVAMMVLAVRGGTAMRFFTLIGQFLVVVVTIIATVLLGTIARESATTPLYEASSPEGNTKYLLRLGTAVERGNLGLYQAEGWHYRLIAAAGMPMPDTQRFASDFRLTRSSTGKLFLVYPSRDGQSARVELPE
ncbi:hypothetical protein [Aeromicrobium wangtongii]|uniref:Uncharacterized protein n=1 Tax=Aeromicrobium wangtongii TaxID=2969247 RepID=A0ABY5M8Y7_9ACTN|nr:hypothetical protein [Aeromicrobium wangtongii]MCD9198230.1 hypothetical protein [Aeromicrobium wangtongii]UUP12266.1 hypothetical protein NQV15_10380 [Aeromicrobium wangtongii]